MSIMTFKRTAISAAVLAAATGLSACGGGTTYVPPAPDVPPVGDTFLNFVAAKAATVLDADEPIAVDSIVATTPEDTEPAAVAM